MDQESSFEDLSGYDDDDNSVSVHQKNLWVLMIEMIKTKNDLNPPFMKEIFCPQTNQYSLRNYRDFNSPRVRSVVYGSETVRCTLPVSMRPSTNLIEFPGYQTEYFLHNISKEWHSTNMSLCKAFYGVKIQLVMFCKEC